MLLSGLVGLLSDDPSRQRYEVVITEVQSTSHDHKEFLYALTSISTSSP